MKSPFPKRSRSFWGSGWRMVGGKLWISYVGLSMRWLTSFASHRKLKILDSCKDYLWIHTKLGTHITSSWLTKSLRHLAFKVHAYHWFPPAAFYFVVLLNSSPSSSVSLCVGMWTWALPKHHWNVASTLLCHSSSSVSHQHFSSMLLMELPSAHCMFPVCGTQVPFMKSTF